MAFASRTCYLLLAFGWLVLPGCRPRDGRAPVQERVLMHNDFEGLDGWLPNSEGILTTEKAHSGRYAIRVDAAHPYSITYRTTLGTLSPHHRPQRLTLSAWVWVPSLADDARLVLAISPANNPDQALLSKHVFLTGNWSGGSWRPVSRSFDMPEGIHADSKLVIYLWHAGASAPVYADDLCLTELW